MATGETITLSEAPLGLYFRLRAFQPVWLNDLILAGYIKPQITEDSLTLVVETTAHYRLLEALSLPGSVNLQLSPSAGNAPV